MSSLKIGDIVRYIDGSLGIVVEPDEAMHGELVAVNWIASTTMTAKSFKSHGAYHAKSDIWLNPDALTKVGRADE